MCRNHSHVTGTLIQTTNGPDVTEVVVLVEQPLTVELSSGGSLTLPAYCVCLIQQEHPAALLDLHRQLTEALAAVGAFRDGPPSTSGPIIQKK